ncbi:Rhodanese-like domain-containing protein [Cynara cardunculus var. scolymus]|uniref:Rhodanese-like domain-containing protein n=1 Tax=Cynara cardunculus var. scolymus TaxID=59895 RepID=A0A118K4F8_CYNCS|nr:Rhodanese-like domain-containing protein [Cynara cardunculus var. scolymus]
MGSLTLTLACVPPKNPNCTATITRKNCVRNLTICSSYSIPVKFRRIKRIDIRLLACKCTSALSSSLISEPNWVRGDNKAEEDERVFIVVNFYRFVFIKDPEEEVSKHLEFLQGRDIHGRIYINEQGINAQYSGPSEDALAYVSWLKEDERFHDILVQISPPIRKHAFPRLKLRYKPSLMEGGVSHLPLIDSSMRATPLTPAEWRKRVEAANNIEVSSHLNPSRKVILLDVRNGKSVGNPNRISNDPKARMKLEPLLDQEREPPTKGVVTSNMSLFLLPGYEWDIGHFIGAQRPNVDCFRSTTFGLSGSEDVASDPLANVDKEKTDILMYCTGGIRCDVYSTILRQRGYKKLYTLRGGISHYLQCEGPVEWIGNLFVFDARLSLPPTSVKHDAKTDESLTHEVSDNTVFAKCYICGSQVSELRHRNCANLDCNLLFLCCSGCMDDLRGCCSSDCTSAARLRPVLPGHERYQKWHHYRDT